MLTANGVLHKGITELFPRHTLSLTALTSFGDVHTYKVTARGHTVREFITIATELAKGNFGTAESLIAKIKLPYEELPG